MGHQILSQLGVVNSEEVIDRPLGLRGSKPVQ